MARKRIIWLRLTEKEADALMESANEGIADQHDSQDGYQLETADVTDEILNRLGQAMRDAGWVDDKEVAPEPPKNLHWNETGYESQMRAVKPKTEA